MRASEIYLDHAASTPMLAEAVEAMLPWLSDNVGNPSGSHRSARAARLAVDDARELLASLIGMDPGGIVFTSGGTEADNLIVAGHRRHPDGVIVCSAIEHPAVLEAAHPFGAVEVGVGRDGVVDLDALARVLDESGFGESALDESAPGRVALVSVMAVNNEVGTIQPLAEIAEVVREVAPQAVLHSDAVQAMSWIDVRRVGSVVDALSLSAHKFGGPKGVGLLAIGDNVVLDARQVGGGQERERRSGTHNVAGIVSMATAARLTDERRQGEVARVAALRDRLLDQLGARLVGVVESAPRDRVIAGIAHVCIDDIDSEALLFLLDEAGICASAASACASGAQGPSHVLAAMGIDRELATGSLRLSLGHTTTGEEIERCVDAVVAAVERLRTYPR